MFVLAKIFGLFDYGILNKGDPSDGLSKIFLFVLFGEF